MMQGRRYSEGLHQALEAKEHVEIQPENQTLASITFQNYFRLYEKLAGMTGTAATEANEFMDIYGSTCSRSRPTWRSPAPTSTTRSIAPSRRRRRAIVAEIADCHRRGQPVLVGTISIEKSEKLSAPAEGPQVHPRARPVPQEAGRRPQGRQGGRAQGAARTRSAPTSTTSAARTAAIPSRTRCSTPATTSRRRRSSPRPACPAP